MKIKSQIAMVLNLDKCLGCHTCTVPCKNAWTSSPGREYMWFNNVETKPGLGYPREWENQKRWQGGWSLKRGKLHLRSGDRLHKLATIFGPPRLPTVDDYYEPWNYTYEKLTSAGPSRHQPVAQAVSAITGEPMTPSWGSNWDDDLAGATEHAGKDPNFEGLAAKTLLQFQHVFMMHMPRLCEHCLNPACAASCPSGAIYKRDEDGIVLVDQTRCRGWRQCVSNCPYKKVYFNWNTKRSEKCLFCYPRIEAGLPTLCAHSCTGRIRYIGIMLYDADKVHEAAASPGSVYESQLGIFLDPNDENVRRDALASGIDEVVLEAAKRSPVYKLAVEWRLALPLHPEFRTLPMVWYVPPASPFISKGLPEATTPPADSRMGETVDDMRIPLRYLANLLSAGDEKPVRLALLRLMALRRHMRETQFSGGEIHGPGTLPHCPDSTGALEAAGLTSEQAANMYRLLAVARYDDRFVLPGARRELTDDVWNLKESAGFPLEDRGEV